MTERAKPCPKCPWWVHADADSIPNFNMALAENLRGCCVQGEGIQGAPIMACHHSKPGEEFSCLGYLAVYGALNISVRLALIQGTIPSEAVMEPPPDWPEMHKDIEEMLDKLRGTT